MTVAVTENRYTVARAAGVSLSASRTRFQVTSSRPGAVTVTRQQSPVTVTSSPSLVNISQPVVSIVTAGTQGPQGPTGASATNPVFTAGQALSALRVVTTNDDGEAVYADKDTQALSILGLTVTAAAEGNSVEVATLGPVEDSGWAWDTALEGVYLGSNGALTQTPPSTGVTARVGFVLSATSIFIRPGEPVINA